jgi:hypothetical protein
VLLKSLFEPSGHKVERFIPGNRMKALAVVVSLERLFEAVAAIEKGWQVIAFYA